VPSRVLRDGLLDSPRWHGISHEARCFFIALLLLADDFGLINLQPIFIGRHAFAKRPSDARLDKLIDELVRVDLLRLYWTGSSEAPVRFGFLPRFRQKLRQMKARHPLPPRELYEDDLDALGKFMQFKDSFQKLSAGRLQPVDRSAAEVKRSEVKRSDLDLDSETKRKEVDSEVPLPLVAGAAPSATDAAAKPFCDFSEGQTPTPHEGNGDAAAHDNAQQRQQTASTGNKPTDIRACADYLGVIQCPGEHFGAFQLRVMQAREEHRKRNP
jgi:hypothetical protein